MARRFTLEYWPDDGWYVGRLREVRGVVSQGETLPELVENIRDAYQLVTEDTKGLLASEIELREVGVNV